MSIKKHKKSVTADIPERTEQRSGYFFVLIFVLMAISIAAIGYFSYRKYQHIYCDQVERNLSTITEQKVDELVDWRQERLGDASIFFKNPVFTSLVRDFIKDPKNVDARWRIQTWMGKMQAGFKYNQVRLFNTQGVNLLSVPANPLPASSVTLQYLPEVLRSGQVMFQDFYRNNYDQHIYLAVLVPILDEKNHNQPLAVLALRIDPNAYLDPFIQKWPVENKTVETLLVRRDGNDALFLNELKFQKDTTLKLRISLEKKEIPAVKAVLGQEGIVEGKDYRGVPVLACLRAVPDSPWFLVARMDTSEVYAPTRERLGVIVVLVLILLFGAAIGLNLLRRQQNLRFYRKQSELAEELQIKNIAIASSMNGIAIADLAGNLNYVNNSFLKLWGYDNEQEVIGKSSLLFWNDPASAQVAAEAIRQNGQWSGELIGKKKDGSIITVQLAGNIILDLANKPLGTMASFLDITARKQAEETLRESKALIEAVVENVPLMIFLKEAKDLRFVVFNRAGEELLGYDRKALLGKNNLDLFPPEQAAHFMAKDREVLDGEAGMLDIPEEPILTAKKGNRLLHTRKVCIRGADGTTKFLLGISEDITERKQAEEERNSLQEQLIRSEKLAAVGELIAGVVHEINNPLTGIKGLSELLLNEAQDEEKKKDLTFIHQSSERIEKIVKNLQRFARREKPSRKYVNINELIDVVISIRDYEMTARNIKIERHYQPDLPLVFTDPSQLEQVFLNLITNAEYAIHDEQGKAGTLTIATSVVPDNAGGTVVIEFSDTGAGIPIDVLPKLFNPFFTTKPVGKGTGLGLSVSYGIIKGHGGDISARNQSEGGAVFTIKLPVRGGGKR